MYKFSLLFLLPALANGQFYGGPAPGPPTTAAAAVAAAPSAPPSNATQINVDVAPNGNFIFNPSNITAAVGTLVTFFFPSGSLAHSVTQSSFEQPCTWLAPTNTTSNSTSSDNSTTTANTGGFDTGLVLSSTFTINVTDNQPIYFHCKQVQHCGLGMVGTINAPTTGSNTFAAFMSAAMAIGANEVTETDMGAVTGGVHGIATAAPVSDVGGSTGSTGSGANKVAVSAAMGLLSAVIGYSLL